MNWKKKIDKIYSKLRNKQILVPIVLFIALLILTILVIQAIREYNSDISIVECDNRIEKGILDFWLIYGEASALVKFFIIYKPVISILLLLIGVSWVLHGVGFYIFR